MMREQVDAVLEPHAPVISPRESAPSETSDESIVVLQRIERLLFEIRGRLETKERAGRHQQFSLGRLLGSLLEVLVVVVTIWTVADWVYQAPPGGQLVKLAFAGVVQLGALTAFVLAREDQRT